MWDGEKKHIAAFDKLITQHDVRLSENVGITCIGGQCQGEGAWTDPTGFADMKAECLKQLVPRHLF